MTALPGPAPEGLIDLLRGTADRDAAAAPEGGSIAIDRTHLIAVHEYVS